MSYLLTALYRRVLAHGSSEDGQATPEYALVIALIALVAIVALQLLGGGIGHVYTVAGNAT